MGRGSRAVDSPVRLRHARGMKPRWRVPVVLALLAGSAAAGGWSNEADVSVRVNGHSFHHVKATADECKLSFEILFDAPESGYSDPKNKVRNYHLFQARVQFAKGQRAESKVFGNSGPGERV